VIMQANKDGFYYVLDRVTGQFISGQPYAQVTWAKGLDEGTGRPIVNQEAHYGTESITLSPGPGGAHNWSPMSFNPATGLVYIPTSSNSSSTFALDRNFTYKPGRSNTGLLRAGRGGGGGGGAAGATGNGAGATAPQPVEARLPSPPAIGPAPQEGQRGILVAWDPVTQKERWRANGGGSTGGGTVTTAGNLVFQVIPNGRLVAYSADKGEKLLDVQTGLRSGMGPPITYQIDGNQYVSLMGGQGSVIARNADATKTGAGANATAGGNAQRAGAPPTPPVRPKLLTFVLDGKGTLPTNVPLKGSPQ
jgi:glucose dehydrogenase